MRYALLVLLAWPALPQGYVPLSDRQRIAVYDYACPCWRYYKLDPVQFETIPDLSTVRRAADGIFRLKQPTVAPLLVGGVIPNATVGVPYSVSLTADGGTPPYAWAVTGGTLPPGLSLSSAGVLSGTATTPGNYTVTVTVTDSIGIKSNTTFTGTPMLTASGSVPGKTLMPGGSILFASATGSDALMLDIDRRNVLHRIAMVPPPQPGTVCEELGVVLLQRGALYLCDDTDSTNNYGKWVRSLVQTTW